MYPDDGTKIIFDATQMHNGGTYDPVNGNQTGGWYATRIEVLRENEDPAVHWVDINYSTEVAGRIESIALRRLVPRARRPWAASPPESAHQLPEPSPATIARRVPHQGRKLSTGSLFWSFIPTVPR